jgi:hypothetical protein
MLDDRGYDAQGRYLAHFFPSLNPTELHNLLGTKQIAYPVIVGFVYFIGGHSILSAKLLNAFFGALLTPVIYWLAAEFRSEDVGLPRRAAWIAAFFPFDIAWSGLLVRDTILELLFTFLLAATVAAVRRRSYWFCGVVLVTLYVINSFRFYAVFVWTGAIVLAVVAELARRMGRQNPKRAWIGFFSLTAAGVVIANLCLLWLIQQFDFVRALALQVIGLGEGGDATPLLFGFNLGFAASFARAIFVYIFGPFPWVFWGIDEPVNFIFYPGMYVIFALFPFFAIGFWKTSRCLEAMKIFVLCTFVLHGLIEIYVFQGAPRQRMMTDAVFIICSALAWPMRSSFPRTIRLAYATLLLIAVGHTILRAFG